jgi:hypothetical protein
MKRTNKLLALLIMMVAGFANNCISQNHLPQKGQFFVYWGYNRAWFADSDIHVYGAGYDLTAYQLKAKDRPSPVSLDYINPSTISIPQFNFRFGYQINDRFSISVGTDHMKYIVIQDQIANISGIIRPEFSEKYQGTYLNTPQKITKDFLRYEHTNGLNYITVEGEYLQPIAHFAKRKGKISWNFGLGGFVLLPKSDIQVATKGADNRYHIAGYAISGKTGPRIDYGRFFLSSELKPGYATMPDILINNDAIDRASQNIAFLQYYIVLGYKFRLFKSKTIEENK